MITLTIPKEIISKKDLIIIPRKEYEELLGMPQKRKVTIEQKAVIPNDQKWFWSKEWQKKEKKADEALKKGEYKKFKNVKDLLKDLHS